MASLDKYKLHNNTWDSDTNPSGFWEFMFLMSATVRAIKWGSILEDYIDVKLGRTQQHAVMTPSFITDDPDFDMPSRPEGSDGEEVSSGDTGSEGGAAPSNGLVVRVTVTFAPVEDRACRVFAVWAGLVVVTLAFNVTIPFMFRFIPCSWFVMSSTDCVVFVAGRADGLLLYVVCCGVGVRFLPV